MKKQTIASAFLEMLKTTPFKDIQVTELVKVAGTTRNSFYYSFDNIYGLVEYIADRKIEEALQDWTVEQWERGLCGLFATARENGWFIYRIVPNLTRTEVDVYLDSRLRPLASEIAAYEEADDVEFTTDAILYMLEGYAWSWYGKGMKDGYAAFVMQMARLLRG